MEPTTFEYRLDRFVRRLRESGSEAPSLVSCGLELADIRAAAPALSPDVPYVRRLLRSTPDCEVAIARWTPGLACAPHDHGVSNGWIYCLEGRLRETEYRWTGESLVEIAEHLREPGSVSSVRADEIHTCVGDGDVLTLHVYFPRSEAVRVFDSVGRRTLTVFGEVGAWFPVPPENVRESRPWPNSR